jgi:hypothetical protein
MLLSLAMAPRQKRDTQPPLTTALGVCPEAEIIAGATAQSHNFLLLILQHPQ